jgi:3-oxoacyl-[acyl-carrier-protein] synthase II
MKRALRRANIDPADIDYINAHGTSTVAGDIMETKAIKQTLGDHAGKVHISATKSMIGHLLAASGSMEIIATAMMIKEGEMLPTINLEMQDSEHGCDLQYVPHRPLKKTITFALKNSFGFGGYNSVLALKRFA